MRRLSTTTRAWPLLLCLLAVSLCGCRTQEKAVRTEYHYIHQHDSVRVEKWDTVRVEVRGDTVRVFEKLHEVEYFSTVYRDTLRQSDTLVVERTTIERPPCKKNGWKWLICGVVFGILIIFAARISIKLLIKK